MKRFRDGLDELLLDTYKIENLVKLLEDYFYDQNTHEGFCKGQTVTDVVLEKLKILNEKMNDLYKQTIKLEKGEQI